MRLSVTHGTSSSPTVTEKADAVGILNCIISINYCCGILHRPSDSFFFPLHLAGGDNHEASVVNGYYILRQTSMEFIIITIL